MSTVKVNAAQIGQSVTATNNFTWYQPASPDGTVRLGVGNSGATTSDVVTVTNAGNTTVLGTLAVSGTGTSTIAGTLNVSGSGSALIIGTGSVGYGTGSGGSVTQITSRTTGVTLNKTNGAITLVSAAGLATYQTFTVTNSTVAATDVIHVCQKSGTDKYIILVTAVAAGSFAITFATTGGITTEQPVFNFAVIKAVTA